MNTRWIFLLTLLTTVACREDIIVSTTPISSPVPVEAIAVSTDPSTLPPPPTISISALPNLQTVTPLVTATPPVPTSAFSPEPTTINLNDYNTSWNVELIGYASGEIRGITMQGNHAYASFAGDLIIFDISDANNPIPVGYLHLPHNISEIIVHDSHAYVIASYGIWCDQEPCGGSFNIIDIANPTSPVLLGSLEFSYQPISMDVMNEIAYVTVGGELVIINIVDTTLPTEIGRYFPPGYVSGVSIEGNYAYLIDTSTLRILDVSNPAAPIETGHYDAEENARLSQPDIKGDYAYLTTFAGTLLVIDVSNPAQPVIAGSFTHSDTTRRHNMLGVKVYGQYAYIREDMYFLDVLDISDPENPLKVSQINYGSDFMVADDYILISRLGRIDISDPQHQKEAGYFHPLSRPLTFDIVDNYAYVIPGNCYATCNPAPWLQIVDISGVIPNVISTYETPMPISALFIDGNYAVFAMPKDEMCTATNVCSWNIHILDITDKTMPTEVGVYEVGGGVTAMVLNEDQLYLTLWGGEFIWVDISRPENPRVVNHIVIPGWLRNIEIREQTAYVLNAATGFHVFDISDPTNLREIGAYSVTPFSNSLLWDMALGRDYAYIVGESGLYVVNITDPAYPVVSATYDHVFPAFITAKISGNFLLVGSVDTLNDQSILRMFDISQPPAIVEVGYFNAHMRYSSAKHLDLAVMDSVIYLANGDAELMKLNFTPPRN